MTQQDQHTGHDSADKFWAHGRGIVAVSLLSFLALFAFESYAITTALPVVGQDLEAPELSSLAFAGTLTTMLVGMNVGGAWADRAGTGKPLLIGGLIFFLGVGLTAIAPDMWFFIIGRLMQGLGGGIGLVVMYVIIAREFPQHFHTRMFGLLAVAWLLPAFIGPVIAGYFVERVHWRALFAVVMVLSLISVSVLLLSTRNTRPLPDANPGG